jgi:DNA polymerase/3'-5' exonuclease PolX
MRMKPLNPNRSAGLVAFPSVLLVFLALVVFLWTVDGVGDNAPRAGASTSAVRGTDDEALDLETRITHIEKTLESIKGTGKAAEERSLFNKVMAIEMVKLVRIAVAVLVFMAAGIPVGFWLLLTQRKRLGPASPSDEITATLVAVEERQAKLAGILRDIQSEIDFLHSMSVPDLRKLIDQAEKYIQQNEKDLEKTKGKSASPSNA